MPYSISSSDVPSGNFTTDVCNYETDHHPLFGVPHDAEFNRCVQTVDRILGRLVTVPRNEAITDVCIKACNAKYKYGEQKKWAVCEETCEYFLNTGINGESYKDLTSEEQREIISKANAFKTAKLTALIHPSHLIDCLRIPTESCGLSFSSSLSRSSSTCHNESKNIMQVYNNINLHVTQQSSLSFI
jgi:hypothetical protein